MFGTKCPSITSRCRKSPPPSSTSSISDFSLAKSADRIDGAIIGAVEVNGSGVMAADYPRSGTRSHAAEAVLSTKGTKGHEGEAVEIESINRISPRRIAKGREGVIYS